MKLPLFFQMVGLGSVLVMLLGLAFRGVVRWLRQSTTRSALSEENHGRKFIRCSTRLFIGHSKNAQPTASLNSPIGNRNRSQGQG